MAVQDDSREQQMTALFNLTVPPGRARSDIDAHLKLPELDEPLPFELKSTTKNSISTVRDFGPEHIAKWRHLHWLFAFYEPNGTTLRYCYYASPADMREWITEKEAYIRPDIVMAQIAPRLVTDEMLALALGELESFDVSAAKALMKNQWSAEQYRQNADLLDGRYSREQMVSLMQERLAYVIRRGSTLNNPHIQESYFRGKGLQQITEDHAATVRELAREYLAGNDSPPPLDEVVASQASAAETDEATA